MNRQLEQIAPSTSTDGDSDQPVPSKARRCAGSDKTTSQGAKKCGSSLVHLVDRVSDVDVPSVPVPVDDVDVEELFDGPRAVRLEERCKRPSVRLVVVCGIERGLRGLLCP